MQPSPASETPPAPHRPVRAADALAQVQRVRPGLAPDSADCRAAVVLLLVPGVGFNVERLVMRTGYPRGFVSLVLRRLADNAFWLDGQVQADWVGVGADAPSFWLDVDVALGKRLRRVSESGAPEWAPVGEWVTDFEYRGEASLSGPVCNAYRAAPEYAPEAVAPLAEEEPALAYEAPAPEEEDEEIDDLDGDEEGKDEEEREEAEPAAEQAQPAPAAAPGMLLGEWASANWLG